MSASIWWRRAKQVLVKEKNVYEELEEGEEVRIKVGSNDT